MNPENGMNSTTKRDNKKGHREQLTRKYINEYKPMLPPVWRRRARDFLHRKEAGDSYIYEVTSFPESDPTPEQLNAAWELYNNTYNEAKSRGWFSLENGKESGYRKWDGRHYLNRDNYFDNTTLSPSKPESLMYYTYPGEEEKKILVGVMYLTDGLDESGKQVGGPLTVWHYHPTERRRCFEQWLFLFSGDREKFSCPEEGIKKYRSPEMMHVWFIKNPEGPFASRMSLPREYINEPEKMNESEFKRYAIEKYRRFYDAK